MKNNANYRGQDVDKSYKYFISSQCVKCSFCVFDQERRVEKKANQTAFKDEKVRQEKQMLSLRANVQGMKL